MSPEISILQVGLVSALGHNYEIANAAARAGISRAQSIPDLLVSDPKSGDREAAAGHFVHGAEGYQGVGRLVRLSALAMAGFGDKTNPIDWSRTGLFVNFSDNYLVEQKQRLELEAENQIYENLGPDDSYAAYIRQNVDENYLQRLREHLDFFDAALATKLSFGGGCGFVDGIGWAAKALSDERIDTVLIGAVDSLVDPHLLDCANNLDLIKTPSIPDGFAPGEAAVFLLCQAISDSPQRRPLFHLGGGHLGQDAFTRFDENPPTGQALSDCITATCSDIRKGQIRISFVTNGTNGDFYKSYDWGNALVKLNQSGILTDTNNVYPAMQFGEVGAAAGAVSAAYSGWLLSKGVPSNAAAPAFIQDYNGKRASYYVRSG